MTSSKPAIPKRDGPAKVARVYRGANNEQRVAERRARLVAAAIKCFGTHGYHQTTLKMLCAEAGLTERYFYESFANFDDILCCAYMDAAAVIFDQIGAKVALAPPTAHERMLAALRCYLAAIATDKARARLVLIEIDGASERANIIFHDRLEMSTDLIEREVCRDLPRKPANGLSSRLMASAILGAIYHVARNWALADFKPARATLTRNLHAMAMATIAAWQAEPATGAPAPSRSSRSK